MSDDEKTYTEDEMQKRIAEIRLQEQIANFGKQWFIEALSHTANLVNQGSFPKESHEVGVRVFQQFMINTGQAKVQQEQKKADQKQE